MWYKKPTPEEISQWFLRHGLHEGLNHENYVSGVVAIEERGQYKPFITGAARVQYFWDWVSSNGYSAVVSTSSPKERSFSWDEDKSATALWVEAHIIVREGQGDSVNVVRSAKGHKQVAQQRKFGNRIVPDMDSLMKAETGAVARALGILGMLTFPGSGIATADDMVEFKMSQDDDSKSAGKGTTRQQSKSAPDPRKKNEKT